MSEQRYRLLRILEYEGTMEWIQKSLRERVIKGTMPRYKSSEGFIREGFVGGVEGFVEIDPETLEEIKS